MTIGKDINGKEIRIKDNLLRSDGVRGSFSIRDFELCFDYDDVQENGAVCSYINHGYTYELI